VGFLFGSSWDVLVSTVGRADRLALVILAVCAAVLVLVRLIRRWKTS